MVITASHQPEALIIDLDGTLLDDAGPSGPLWDEALADTFPYWPVEMRAEAVRAIQVEALGFWSDPDRHRWGRLHMVESRARIAGRVLIPRGWADRSTAERVAQSFTHLRDEACTWFPGAPEALDRLRARGLSLALMTNGDARVQRPKVERLGLSAWFPVIHIEGEQGVGKPLPRAYLMVAKRLGVSLRSAWMVGDHGEWEVRAPKRLSMTTVWIRQDTDPLVARAADFVVASFGDVPDLLE
jgi:putative hydrolase of the HAD superfamily